ncbi:hypothetical protein DFJ77DRAFT_480576 [Powellomyces hirtus]|nr:hypothetical protein DFJ77DRAFT_480576 [Powellomyces hirtus]
MTEFTEIAARILLLAVTFLIGGAKEVRAACSLVTTTYKCPEGQLFSRFKFYTTSLSDGTPGLRFWGAQCTQGKTFGQFDLPFPQNTGVWDDSSDGQYYQMAVYKNSNPPAALGCSPTIVGMQTFVTNKRFGWGTKSSRPAWAPQSNSAWTWIEAGPECVRYQTIGSNPSFINSITIKSLSTGSPYVVDVTYSCSNIFHNPGTGIIVRPSSTTIMTSDMVTIQTKSGVVGQPTYEFVGEGYLLSDIGTFVKYDSTGAAMSAAGSGASFTQADVAAGKVAFVSKPLPSYPTSGRQYLFAVSDNGPWDYQRLLLYFNTHPSVTTRPVMPSSLSPTTITTTNLQVQDDDPLALLNYTVTSLPPAELAGSLYFNNVALINGSHFTQKDVVDGKLTLQPVLTPGVYDVTVQVADRLPGSVSAVLSIVFSPPGYATGDVQSEWVTGSAPRFLGLPDLINPVAATPIGNVRYHIDTMSDGMVIEVFDGSVWAALRIGDSFTAYQVYKQLVRLSLTSLIYGNTMLSYTVMAGGSTASGKYKVYSKYPPVVTVADTLIVGQTAPPFQLQPLLSASDVDTNPSSLEYTLLNNTLPGGTLWRSNGTVYTGPLAAGMKFTQSELAQNLLQIRLNSSQSGPGELQFQLSDGVFVRNASLHVNIVMPPKVTNTVIVIPYNRSSIIPASALYASSTTIPAQRLNFTIVTPFRVGLLSNASDADATISSFTASDIAAGFVKYTPALNGNGTHTMALSISDGTNAPLNTNFSIRINTVPWVARNLPVAVTRDAVASVTSAILLGADSPGTGNELIYTIDASPQMGCFRIAPSTACVTLASWSHSTMLANKVSFAAYHVLGTEPIGLTISDGLDQIRTILTVNVTPAPVLLTHRAMTLCAPADTNSLAIDLIRSYQLSASCGDTPASGLTYRVLNITNTSLLSLERYDGAWRPISVGGTWLQSDVDGGNVRVTRTTPDKNFKADVALSLSNEFNVINFTLSVNGGFMPRIRRNNPLKVTPWFSSTWMYSSNLGIDNINMPYGSISYQVTSLPSYGTVDRTAFVDDYNNYHFLKYTHATAPKTLEANDSLQMTFTDGICSSPQSVTIVIQIVNQAPYNWRSKAETLLPYPTTSEQLITRSLLEYYDDDGPLNPSYTLLSLPSIGALRSENTSLGIGSQWNASALGKTLWLTNLPTIQNATFMVNFNYSVTDGLNIMNSTFNVTFLRPPVLKTWMPPLCNPDLRASPVCYWGREAMELTSDRKVWWDFPQMAPTYYSYQVDDYGYYKFKTPNPLIGFWYLDGVRETYYSSSFEQDTINARRVGYGGVDLVRNTSVSPAPARVGYFRFPVSYTDRVNPSVSQTFQIWWNAPPASSVNNTLRFSVDSNHSKALLNTTFAWTDKDNSTAEIKFTLVAAPAEGQLVYLSDTTGESVMGSGATWTMDDINNRRVVVVSTVTNTSGRYDNFQFNVTDGVWTIANQYFAILNDDVPVLSKNNSLQIDWDVSPFASPLRATDLSYSDRYQTGSSLVYTLTSSPGLGQVQLRRTGSSIAQLYNETYCTCDLQSGCVPPLPFCYYTFTQADVDAGVVYLAGSKPGRTSLSFRLSDGIHVLPNQTYAFTFYSKMKIALSRPLIEWTQPSLLLSNQTLNVKSAEPDTGPSNITYELVTPMGDFGYLQKWDGAKWSAMTTGSSWTQQDVIGSLIRFFHSTNDTTRFGNFVFDVMISDGIAKVTTAFTVFVPGLFTVGATKPVVLTQSTFEIDESFFKPRSLNTASFTYTITSSPHFSFSACRSYSGWYGRSTSCSYQRYAYTTADLTNNGYIQVNTLYGAGTDHAFDVTISDGVNRPISVTYLVHHKLQPVFAQTQTLLVPSVGRALLSLDILNVTEPDWAIVANVTSPLEYVFHPISSTYPMQRRNASGYWVDLPTQGSSWTTAEMGAGNISFRGQGSAPNVVSFQVGYRNPWQRVTTSVRGRVFASPVVTSDTSIKVAVNGSATSSSSTAKLVRDTGFPDDSSYQVLYEATTMPELGVVITCNTSLASSILLASLSGVGSTIADPSLVVGANVLSAGMKFNQSDLDSGALTFVASAVSGQTKLTITVSDQLSFASMVDINIDVNGGPVGNLGCGVMELSAPPTSVLSAAVLKYSTGPPTGVVRYTITSLPDEVSLTVNNNGLNLGDSFDQSDIDQRVVKISWTGDLQKETNATLRLAAVDGQMSVPVAMTIRYVSPPPPPSSSVATAASDPSSSILSPAETDIVAASDTIATTQTSRATPSSAHAAAGETSPSVEQYYPTTSQTIGTATAISVGEAPGPSPTEPPTSASMHDSVSDPDKPASSNTMDHLETIATVTPNQTMEDSMPTTASASSSTSPSSTATATTSNEADKEYPTSNPSSEIPETKAGGISTITIAAASGAAGVVVVAGIAIGIWSKSRTFRGLLGKASAP